MNKDKKLPGAAHMGKINGDKLNLVKDCIGQYMYVYRSTRAFLHYAYRVFSEPSFVRIKTKVGCDRCYCFGLFIKKKNSEILSTLRKDSIITLETIQ
jgi:hypothetical protein